MTRSNLVGCSTGISPGFAPQNLVDKIGGASKQVGNVWSVGHQTSRFDVLPDIVNRRQSRGERQGIDSDPVGDYERVANNIECLRAALERLEGGCDILGSPDFEGGDIEAERARSRLNPAHLLRDVG